MITRLLSRQVAILGLFMALFYAAPAYASSPIVDDFSSFSGWTQWSSPLCGDNLHATSTGYVGNGVAASNSSPGFCGNTYVDSVSPAGTPQLSGGFRIWARTINHSTAIKFGASDSANSSTAHYIYASVALPGYLSGDTGWHSIDFVWENMGTSTRYGYAIDATSTADITSWIDTGATPIAYDHIFLGNTNGVFNGDYSYFDELSNEFGSSAPVNYNTHIVSFTPVEGTTTGNNVDFDLHVYINPDDLSYFQGVELTYKNIDQNFLLSNIPFVTHDELLLFSQATTSGDFYFHKTVTLPDGNYRVQAKIARTLIGTFINPFSSINDTQNHQFVVNQESFLGHLNQNGFDEFNQLFASTTATSTAAAATNCNPLTFSISQCLAFLFIPGGPQLDETVSSFQSGVVSRAPWGYFYRLYEIVSGTSTASLPGYTVAFQVGPPDNLATTSLTYDPGDMIAGGGALLDSIHDPYNGMTVRQVFEPYVLLIIAIVVMLQIWHDITGSHRHHTPTPGKRT